MNELIRITTDEQGSLVVSSLDFAAGLDIQHKNLLETIRTHREIIERDFGLIAFETRKIETGKGRPESVAQLTEDQALFIGTLSRNSKRVVEFKSVLVKSFADARKRLLAPAPPSTEQVLMQLVSQSQQILLTQEEMLSQLRADVDQIMHNKRPAKPGRLGKQLSLPGLPRPRPSVGTSPLRQLIHTRVMEYCGFHDATTQETYTYLYKRLFDVYSINVYRLTRAGTESMLDALERYGHLDKVYGLVMAELSYSEE
ncbi:Rha family transcriptional regulator [Spirosoma validum]|uniref:Rha family transcriptional regulator n=1 Tax=Spirosoma validum TaxID=2771355 RepID=A0A927B1U1_9BACT|nr:Rha family transcriptional regulator [Spirosoma validum]MBD2753768.1 Rha family transcriptional regulator [Spirosoma validum]